MSRSRHEADRLLAENRRREREIGSSRYEITDPAELLARQERSRVAIRFLDRLARVPHAGDPVLEIGYGRLGWLAELLGWGLACEDLHGIELDPERAMVARQRFPNADLRAGNAVELPWERRAFKLVILSTVLTSVLDRATRRAIADEAIRVMHPEGALIWYDFRWHNPSNSHVRGIGRREIRSLFPGLTMTTRSVTLAPPLARRLTPFSLLLAEMIGSIPLLRSHLLAVLTSESGGNR